MFSRNVNSLRDVSYGFAHNPKLKSKSILSKCINSFQFRYSSLYCQSLHKRTVRLLFLGAPGVGKGTYSKILAPHLNATIMASGDLLRDISDSQVLDCIKNGRFVPDEIVIPLVIEFLRNLDCSLIFDGFPRTIYQAQTLQTEYPLDLAIHFCLPHEILVRKMLGRRVCIQCKENYNVTDINEGDIIMPPLPSRIPGVCDLCHSPLETRIDDTKDIIEKRLKTFYAENEPIVKFYKDSGILIEHNVKTGINDMPHICQKIEQKLINDN